MWITLWEASFSEFRPENRRDCGKGSCSKPHVIFPFCHVQAGLKQPMSAGPMMGDAEVMPRAVGHLHPSQELGAVQPAWVWVRHLGLAWSSAITLQVGAPSSHFSLPAPQLKTATMDKSRAGEWPEGSPADSGHHGVRIYNCIKWHDSWPQ